MSPANLSLQNSGVPDENIDELFDRAWKGLGRSKLLGALNHSGDARKWRVLVELGKNASTQIVFLNFRDRQKFNTGKVLGKTKAGFSGSSGTFPLERLQLREELWSTAVVTETEALDRIANAKNKGDFVALIRSQDKVSKIGSSSKLKGSCAIIVPGKLELAELWGPG